ncbi:carbon-nitrogen hydrolase family protein [Paraconexibacter sp.]|uniref:carbon-nitrogen hydrolase family protein n=1 Tax=Paraconexibacter sp. TaxID=2949640 RepID=UPI00356A1C70
MFPSSFAVAAVAAPFGRDVHATIDEVGRLIDDLRPRGVRLLVLPECALGGYVTEPGIDDDFAPEVGPTLDPYGAEIERLADLAGDVVVVAGFTERGADGTRYSSAICVSGAGVHGLHRKVHLPPTERFIFTAGDRFAAFDTPLGRIGMLLCYDKCFPEAARTLAHDGAEVLVCPAAWPADRLHPAPDLEQDRQMVTYDALDVARAAENQVVFVSANLAGRQGALRYLGKARVVGPHGLVLAQTTSAGGVAVADVARADIAETRSVISHLADLRPATYHAGLGEAGAGVAS